MMAYNSFSPAAQGKGLVDSFSGGGDELELEFQSASTEIIHFDMPRDTALINSHILLEKVLDLGFETSQITTLPVVSGAVMGDYNNDFHTDIAVFTSLPGNNILLKNKGNNEFDIIDLPGTISSTGGAWGDLDNDGDLDLAVMTEGENYLVKTKGSLFELTEGFGNRTSRCADWGDLNNDGLLDLVVGNDGENQIFINNGNGFQELARFGAFDTRAIRCGDINNDGLLDVVVGNHGPDYYFKNLGTGFFGQIMLSGTGNTNAMHLADTDKDGTLEIFAGMDGTNLLYDYLTGVSFDKRDIQSSLSTTSVSSGDMDMDGYLDLVEGNNDGENRILLNDGNGQFVESLALGEGNTGAVLPDDLDGDGDMDVVVIYSNDHAELHCSTYRSDVSFGIDIGGDGIEDARVATAFPIEGFSSEFGGLNTTAFSWGDYDNDGDLDLALGNYGGQNYLCTNRGDGVFVLSLQFASGLPLAMDWGDYDNDGDLDLAVGNNGYNHLFTNTGTGFDQRSEFGINYTVAVRWADVNLDGRLDLVAINHGTQSKLYLNRGTYFEPIDAFGAGSAFSLAVGDYDADGDEDVAVGKLLGDQNKLFINSNGQYFTELNAFGNRPITAMAWGDFDKDGDLDLAVSHRGYRNALYSYDQGSFTQSNVLGDIDAIAMEATDYDLDGNLDVIMTSFPGLMEIYAGDGTGGFSRDSIIDLNTSISCIAMGRLDRDPFPDIAVGTTGGNLICMNMGNGLELTNIMDPVNRYIEDHEPQGEENISVPIEIASSGPGRLLVSEPLFEYTIPPECRGIPSIFSIYEDTLNEKFLDLTEFFYDDVDRGDELHYKVMNNSLQGVVDCYIHEGHFLAFDALTGDAGDNYTGAIELVVEARDTSNLSVISDPFSIIIMNANDPPAPEIPIDDVMLSEEGIFELDLEDKGYFVDGDGDELYYDIMIDPRSDFGEDICFTGYIEEEVFTINTLRNGTCRDLPVWILADDDPNVDMPGTSTDPVYQEILVTVSNINDPPYLKKMEDIYLFVNEDLNDALNVEDYVIDVDTPMDELIIQIEDLSDLDNFDVRVDWNNFIDIKVKEEDYTGYCEVLLSVSDGEFTAYGGFNIIIRGRNNPPTTSLVLPGDSSIIPTSSVMLIWEGNDEDGDEISYDVYLSRTAGDTGFYRTDYRNNSIVVDGLLDDTTYYWQVYPKDKFDPGTAQDGIHSFTVDLDVDEPRVSLLFPENGAIIGAQRITLSWRCDYPGKLPVTYEILLYNESGSPRTYLSSYENEHVIIDDLENNSVHYWFIIPRAGNIQGKCVSGTYKFSVALDSDVGFPVDLFFEDTGERYGTLGTRPGERIEFNISIHSRLFEKRTVTLFVEGHPKIIEGVILARESVLLYPQGQEGDDMVIKVLIDMPVEFGEGTFSITIRAMGGDEEASRELEIFLEVGENENENRTRKGSENYFWVIPAAVVTLVVALFFFVVISRRKARSLCYEDVPEKAGEDPGDETGTRAYSLEDGMEITVDTVLPVKARSLSKGMVSGGKITGVSGKMGDVTGSGRYSFLSDAGGNDKADVIDPEVIIDIPVDPYPVYQAHPYQITGEKPYGSMPQYPYDPYELHIEEYRKSTEEYYSYMLSLVSEAEAAGADIADAEKLVEEIEDEFGEARAVQDFNRIIDYCNAVGNSLNRAMSRLEKEK